MKKEMIIDTIILIIYGLILMIGIYILYETYPTLSRLVGMLIIAINIPICWGYIMLSNDGKKTIGNIIMNKKKNTNN